MISSFMLPDINGSVLWAYILVTIFFILVLFCSLEYILANPEITSREAFILGLSWMLISFICDICFKLLRGDSLEGYFLVFVPYTCFILVPVIIAFAKNRINDSLGLLY